MAGCAVNTTVGVRVGGRARPFCSATRSIRNIANENLDPILMSPYPEGFSDHQVGVIRIDDAGSGEPIAVLVNFAAHPTIMAWDNRLLSPDYPGTLRRTVESIVGGTCLFLQGVAGNQDTIRDYACRAEAARGWANKSGLKRRVLPL